MEHASPEHYQREGWEKAVEGVMLALLFIVSLIANGTICIVLLQGRSRLNSVSNRLLLSLLSANLLLALCHVPFSIVSVILDRWVFGNVFCNLTGFLASTFSAASNFSISAVSLHRYYLVIKPLSTKINKARARIVIAYVWFTATVFSSPPLFGWNNYNYSLEKGFCTVQWEAGGPGLVYSFFIVAAVYLTPLVTMVYTYRAIYKTTKTQRIRTDYNTIRGLCSGFSWSFQQTTFSESLQKVFLCSSCRRSNAEEEVRERMPPAALVHSTSFTLSNTSSSYLQRGDFLIQGNRTKSTHNMRANTKLNLSYKIKTLQNALLLITSFLICYTPYYFVNLWTCLSLTTPSHVTEFVTSWLYISITAVNPLLYGYLNRHIKRAVLKLPLCKRLCMIIRGCQTSCARAVESSRNIHDGPISWAASNEGISLDY